MNDTEIQKHIEELVAEEHRLLEKAEGSFLTPEERERFDRVNVALDRFWDLLRQRRARRDAGQDPNLAELRPEKIVEKYRQ